MNPKVPFRNIFSNDTTHLENCTSPYRRKGENYRPEFLDASVREVSGLVDAHFIQLAHGQVPWYKSRVYPYEEHLKWWSEYFEVPWEQIMSMKGIHGYVRDGGDVLADFLAACRKYHQAAFVSLRLNDQHHIENCTQKGHLRGIHSINRFLIEHKDFMFGEDLSKWANRSVNWIHPEVPAHMLELITEQCEDYDIDGYELDFMRHPHMFDPNATTIEERSAIMDKFIRDVRAVLDRTERNGKHRWLCVRVPSSFKIWDELGLIPEHMETLGVEMVNVSSSFFTDQWINFREFTNRMPNLAVYFEICHTTTTGPLVRTDVYDAMHFRRATENEIYTTAHLAYQAGAQGMSYFNFFYYREEGAEGRGPFNEPPFDSIGYCKDPVFVASSPQHYFLAQGWTSKSQLRNMLAKDEYRPFEMFTAAPTGGWTTGSFRFRIMTRTPIGNRQFELVFNGLKAKPTADISEPYLEDLRYPPMHGTEENSLAWEIPISAIRNGTNNFTLRWTSDSETEPIRVDYIDLFPHQNEKSDSKNTTHDC